MVQSTTGNVRKIRLFSIALVLVVTLSMLVPARSTYAESVVYRSAGSSLVEDRSEYAAEEQAKAEAMYYLTSQVESVGATCWDWGVTPQKHRIGYYPGWDSYWNGSVMVYQISEVWTGFYYYTATAFAVCDR